jgi:hypothetical protein
MLRRALWGHQLEVALLPALHRAQLARVDDQLLPRLCLPAHEGEALPVVGGPVVVAADEKGALAGVVAMPRDALILLLPACLTLIRWPMLLLVKRPLQDRRALTTSASPSSHAQKWPGRMCTCSSVDHSSRAYSSPVVAALNSGNSDSPQLNAIVRWLFDRRPLLQLLARHQPGKRNGAADSLSRDDRERVLREAAEGGARAVTIDCHATSRALALMALSFPQRGLLPRSHRRRVRGSAE